jgi:hypothetical protein
MTLWGFQIDVKLDRQTLHRFSEDGDQAQCSDSVWND